jgi:hypothetical protein
MKTSSFLTKILTLIGAFFINSCEKDMIEHPLASDLNGKVVTSDLAGSWKVISFDDYETSTKIIKTIDNTWQCCNGENTVSFIMSNSTSGTIEGFNVTNSFHGNFAIDQKGRIFIYSVIWTERGEPEWGYLFHSLEEAETYEIRGGQLIIFYNQKKNSITLQKN